MTIINKIVNWGKERGILDNSNSLTQLAKLTEEHGEVAKAILLGDKEGLEKEIGDAGVVLTLLAKLNGFDFEQCMIKAHNKNNSRKTKMINGTAVKESDLK